MHTKGFVLISLLVTVLVLGVIGTFINFINHSKVDDKTIFFTPSPFWIQPTTILSCIDSNEQCEGKSNGTYCSLGVWCDENERMCGGISCVGMSDGKCWDDNCISKKPPGQSESLHADWTVYEHNRFTFEYPSNWRIPDFAAEDSVSRDMVYIESKYMDFSLYINPPATGDVCMNIISSEEIDIDGILTNYVLWRRDTECAPDAEENSQIFISFDRDSDYYVLTLVFPSEYEREGGIIIKKLVESFMFTEK